MAYFKFNRAFLNLLTFNTSTYAEFDSYFSGIIKNFLNGNQSYYDEFITSEEKADLKSEIESTYNSEVLSVFVPQYKEVLKLATQQKFTSKNTTVSEYGDETSTGKYYEPFKDDSQAVINTSGNVNSFEDDTSTVDSESYQVLDHSAIKDFFNRKKAECERFFLKFINTYIDDCCVSENETFTDDQLEALNSGITATKVAQIESNKNNITNNSNNISSLNTRVTNNKNDIDSAKARLDVDEANIQTLFGNRAKLDASNLTEQNVNDWSTKLNLDSKAERDASNLDSEDIDFWKSTLDVPNLKLVAKSITESSGDINITGLNFAEGDTFYINLICHSINNNVDVAIRFNNRSTGYNTGGIACQNTESARGDQHIGSDWGFCGYVQNPSYILNIAIKATILNGVICCQVLCISPYATRVFAVESHGQSLPITSIRFATTNGGLQSGAKILIYKGF